MMMMMMMMIMMLYVNFRFKKISLFLLDLAHFGVSLDHPKHLSLGAWIFIEKEINLQQKRLGDFSSISECKRKWKQKKKYKK